MYIYIYYIIYIYILYTYIYIYICLHVFMLLIFKSYEIKVFYLSITGGYGIHIWGGQVRALGYGYGM